MMTATMAMTTNRNKTIKENMIQTMTKTKQNKLPTCDNNNNNNKQPQQ